MLSYDADLRIANVPTRNNQPMNGMYKFQLRSSLHNTSATSADLSIVPSLTLPNTLSSTPFLVRYEWWTVDIDWSDSIEKPVSTVISPDGQVFAAGVVSTVMNNMMTTFLRAVGIDPVFFYFQSLVSANDPSYAVIVAYQKGRTTPYTFLYILPMRLE